MKICPSCGAECKDTDKFCENCGAPFDAEPAVPETPAKTSAAVPSGKQAKLKSVLSSKLALVIVIAFTIAAICASVSISMIPSAIIDNYDELIDTIIDADLDEYLGEGSDIYVEEAGEQIRQFLNENKDTTKVTVSLNFGAVLLAVCLWITYATAKSDKSPCCSDSGVEILKVLKIIGVVCAIILSAVLVVGCLVLAGYLANGEYAEFASIAYAVAGVIGGICLFDILYRFGIIATLKRLSADSRDAQVKGRYSIYAGIILFIKGILGFVLALAAAALIALFGSAGVLGFVSVLATALARFDTGLIIFRCRREMKTAA